MGPSGVLVQSIDLTTLPSFPAADERISRACIFQVKHRRPLSGFVRLAMVFHKLAF